MAVGGDQPADTAANDDDLLLHPAAPSALLGRLAAWPGDCGVRQRASHGIGDGPAEERVVVEGFSPFEPYTEPFGLSAVLDIDIVEHLDVIADKADRHEQQVVHTIGRQLLQRLLDGRTEPRVGRSALALEGEA